MADEEKQELLRRIERLERIADIQTALIENCVMELDTLSSGREVRKDE